MIERTRFYDTIAEDFDRIMNPYDLARRLEVVFEVLLAGIDPRGVRLLDAGCGTGAFSLAARGRGARVVSLDLGVNLLRVGRRKGLAELVAADIGRLPFADGSFDVVLSSECIEHTPDPRRAVTELVRVMRPGGTLALTCPNRFWRWSCTVANTLRLRPYQGLENWPGYVELRRWVEEAGASVRLQRGLHLFPFVLAPTWPLLRRLDRFGTALGPVYVNQCLRAVKRL